ncbi:unnamed protein product [Ectocarpus sp. 8 AP-2014]
MYFRSCLSDRSLRVCAMSSCCGPGVDESSQKERRGAKEPRGNGSSYFESVVLEVLGEVVSQFSVRCAVVVRGLSTPTTAQGGKTFRPMHPSVLSPGGYYEDAFQARGFFMSGRIWGRAGRTPALEENGSSRRAVWHAAIQ